MNRQALSWGDECSRSRIGKKEKAMTLKAHYYVELSTTADLLNVTTAVGATTAMEKEMEMARERGRELKSWDQLKFDGL